MTHATLTVLERHMLLYRRLWRATVLSSFLMPALFLASLGLGVGSYVGNVNGVSYLSWIAPALLVSTCFQVSVSESTYGILSDFEWVGGLHAMRRTRVRIADMIGGWLLYVLVITELAVTAFMLAMWAFGAMRPALVLAAPLVGALVALAVATPTMAFSATIDNGDYFQLLTRFLILPATLFSGVYFPVQQLPLPIRLVAYVSPLWHAVDLIRFAALGGGSVWAAVLHAGYLAAFALLGYVWAYRAFRRRLTY